MNARVTSLIATLALLACVLVSSPRALDADEIPCEDRCLLEQETALSLMTCIGYDLNITGFSGECHQVPWEPEPTCVMEIGCLVAGWVNWGSVVSSVQSTYIECGGHDGLLFRCPQNSGFVAVPYNCGERCVDDQ